MEHLIEKVFKEHTSEMFNMHHSYWVSLDCGRKIILRRNGNFTVLAFVTHHLCNFDELYHFSGL